jgi:hypothetical protein
MFDYNMVKNEECNDPVLGRVTRARVATGYIVKQHYYQKLIDNIEEGNKLLKETGMHWLYANDVYWHSLQENDQWFYFKQKLCVQRPSSSDDGYSLQN